MLQTILKLPRVAQAPPTPLTSLLSQYELLSLLCENLTSADIIHLGATCREHWQYVGHNPVILKRLITDSTCDEKGTIAQARVFGYWQATSEKATWKCSGEDARPCCDCGAMVCNMCRYHISYRASDILHEPEDWNELEEELAYDVRDSVISEGNSSHVVELVKAIRMYSIRDQPHCEECEPLFVKDESVRGWCNCTLHSHFVTTWRCIPCVLAEETKLIASQPKFKVEYRPGYPKELRFWKTTFCACGKEEADMSTETCRWCGKIA